MIRYFRSSPITYTYIAAQLDAAYGYPRPETHTDRALPTVDTLPTDEIGRVYLAVSAKYCNYILPSQLLADMLFSGEIEEITFEQYQEVLPEIVD